MISRPTVVVVGAGASYELGLPVGNDLKSDIADLLNITFPDGHNQKTGDYQIKELVRQRAINRSERDWNSLLHKCWLLRDALPGSLSIDNLLDAHRTDDDVAFIGKLAIAKTILRAEKASKLYREPGHRELTFTDVADTWLVPFFQIASEGVSKEDANGIFQNVTFIVFNYDRCIERFLPAALKLYYSLSDTQAEEIAQNAKIIHPYGQVGSLSRSSSLEYVPFGSDRYELPKVASGIKTFSEGILTATHKDGITEAIQHASQILFLGFAFHPLNMGLLSVEEVPAIQKVFGTTLGLSEAAVRAVKAGLFSTIRKRKLGMPGLSKAFELEELNLEPKGAHQFLTEHFRGLAN